MDPQPADAFGESPVPSSPTPSDLRLRSLAVDIIRRPTRAMTRLAAQPGRRWVWPVVVLALLGAAATAAGMPAAQRYQSQVTLVAAERMADRNPEAMNGKSPAEVAAMSSSGQFAAIGTAVALVGALIGVLVGVAVLAAVLHFLGTALGGQQTFTQMLTIVSWAHVPLIFREALRLIYHLLGRWDPSPAGLSGLVACRPSDAECVRSYVGPLLAQIDLWNVWYWFLLVLGVAVVAHISRRKAVIGVSVVVLLQVVLGLVGVFAGRALAGLGGG
jgi:hypothetical protein